MLLSGYVQFYLCIEVYVEALKSTIICDMTTMSACLINIDLILFSAC